MVRLFFNMDDSPFLFTLEMSCGRLVIRKGQKCVSDTSNEHRGKSFYVSWRFDSKGNISCKHAGLSAL